MIKLYTKSISISNSSIYSIIDFSDDDEPEPSTSANLQNIIYQKDYTRSLDKDKDCISILDKYTELLNDQDLDCSISLNEIPDYEQIYRISSPEISLTINEEFEQTLSLTAQKYRSLGNQYSQLTDSRQFSKNLQQNHSYSDTIEQNSTSYNQKSQLYQKKQNFKFKSESYQPTQFNNYDNGNQNIYFQPLKENYYEIPPLSCHSQKTGSDLDAFLEGNTNISSLSIETKSGINNRKLQTFPIGICRKIGSNNDVKRILENSPVGGYTVPNRTASLQPRGKGYNY